MRSAPAMREACGREQQTGRDRALRSGGEASASGIAVQPGTTGVGDGAPPPKSSTLGQLPAARLLPSRRLPLGHRAMPGL